MNTLGLKCLLILILCLVKSARAISDVDPLINIVSIGINNSYGIKSQKLRYLQTLNSQKSNWANLFPTLTLAAGRTTSSSQTASDPSVVTTDSQSNTLSLTGTWILWNNYQNIRDIEKGKLDIQGEEITNNKELQTYVQSLLEAYLDLQLALNRKVIVVDFKEQAQWTYDRTLQLVKAGVKTNLDVLEAEIQLRNAERDLLEAESTIGALQKNLLLLINSEKSPTIDRIDLLKYEPYYVSKFTEIWPQFQENLPQKVIKSSPDLKLNRLDTEKSLLDYKQQRLSYFPSVGLTYTQGMNLDGSVNPSWPEYQKKNLQSSSLALTLSWTVWDWFTTHRRVDNSYLSYRASNLSYLKNRDNIITQTENLYDQFKTLMKSIEASELILKKSAEQMEYSKELFKLGRIIVLQMKQANTSYVQSKLDLMSRMRDKYVLMAKMLYNLAEDISPNSIKVQWEKDADSP